MSLIDTSLPASALVLADGAPAVSAPSVDALVALTGPSGQVLLGADIYQADGTTLYLPNVGIIDGSVTVDYSRDERRMIDVTLSNNDGRIVHNVGDFWYDKIIKVYRGIAWNGGADRWGCQIGEFMIDKIAGHHFPSTLAITGRDYTKKLLLSEFPTDTAFPGGTRIEDIVFALVVNAGVPAARAVLPRTFQVLASDWTISGGTTRKKAIDDLLGAYGYETFFNAAGQYVMREFRDPATSPQTMVFSGRSQDGNLVGWDKISDDSNLKNHIVVTVNSSSASAAPVWAEAINNMVGSPTNVATLGDRVSAQTTTLDLTWEQALAMANNFLKVAALEDYEIDMQSLVLPHLGAGDVVSFMDPDPTPGQPTSFLLTSFDIPLKLGVSSAVAKRVAVVI